MIRRKLLRALPWALLGCLASHDARAQFSEVTPATFTTSSSRVGAALADYDGDGDLDISVAEFGTTAPTLELFRNDGGFQFVDVTATALPSLGVQLGGLAWADYDEDGDLDAIACAQNGANALLQNDGDGTFTNVTIGDLNIASAGGRGPTWSDFDGDGDLDIYAARPSATNTLYRNDGSNLFEDITPANLQFGSQTVSWGDFDGDGDPDVMGADQSGQPAHLMRNDGTSFAAIGASAGFTTVFSNLGVAWGDSDNDLDLDMMLMSFGRDVLARNNGNGTFSDLGTAALSDSAAIAGPCWGDFDHDGDLDAVAQGQVFGPVVILRNDGANILTNATPAAVALNGFAMTSWGDLDNDGDLDLYLNAATTTNKIFRNDLPAGNHWLRIELEGSISNRSAIGARVLATAGGVTQLREVQSGNGFMSEGTIPVELGLGAQTVVTSLSIRWPTGITQTLTDVSVDRVIEVVEPGFTPKGALANGFAPNQTIDFKLERRGVALTFAELFFRPAGSSASFTNATLTINGGLDELQAAIGSGLASENGIEYFVRYRIRNGQLRQFPRSGPAAPAFLPASLGNRVQPTAPPANEYVLFSVPFVAATPTLAGVLEDDLGAYDDTRWRFGRFSPSGGNYLEAGAAPSMTPGRGFWLIERNPVLVDALGASTNTVGGTAIPVDPGWNQIGHPYLFDVPTSAVTFVQAPGVTNRFVGRENNAYVDQTTLEPWKGYWVFNGGAGTQTIVIPGQAGLALAPAAVALEEQLEWGIEVAARSSTSSDVGNVIGVVREGEPSTLSFPEPPGMPETVRAYFLREGEAISAWTTDVRAPGGSGESFALVVETPAGGATLTFSGLERLPADHRALLLADESLTAIDLEPSTAVNLPGAGEQRFRLIVGTPSAIDAARAGVDRIPEKLFLAPPRPNPFADATEIAFALPRASRVEVAIHNVTGRLVKRIASGSLATGVHRLQWLGDDEAGAAVTGGVYFVRLVADGKLETRKIVRID